VTSKLITRPLQSLVSHDHSEYNSKMPICNISCFADVDHWNQLSCLILLWKTMRETAFSWQHLIVFITDLRLLNFSFFFYIYWSPVLLSFVRLIYPLCGTSVWPVWLESSLDSALGLVRISLNRNFSFSHFNAFMYILLLKVAL